MKVTKVLIVNTIGLSLEGITSVIYNYSSHMDKDSLELDFVCFDGTRKDIVDKFNAIGNLIYMPNRKKHVIKYVLSLYKILHNDYDVIHIHGNSGTMLLETLVAKTRQIPKILVHAHNTTCSYPTINKILKYPMKLFATNLLSCSESAGNWLYGKSEFSIINNAIDLNEFTYSQQYREKYRKELALKDEFVIGHIGHFTTQKNHTFLIDVFYYFQRYCKNSKLLLVSDGPCFENIKQKVRDLGLEEKVLFLGRRSDISKLYNAMDAFLLPSLWEGLPLVMLEAQAYGLPLLVSDSITQDAVCTKRVTFKPLSDKPQEWAKTMCEIKDLNLKCENMSYDIQKNGFDIDLEANKLKQIYID